MDQKYRMIDPGFVRLRNRPTTSENMKAQLQKLEKLELCKDWKKLELLFYRNMQDPGICLIEIRQI